MDKLYKKSEITFAIIWIVAYVVISSYADQFSQSLGIAKSVTAPVHLMMVAILYFWTNRNKLSKKYGLCKSKIPAKKFLFYLPLAIVACSTLWGGIDIKYDLPGTILIVVSMCCVGFLEEVIFRGLLFRAMEKDSLKSAVIVSSLTFGLGHIVNLFNGSGQELLITIIQIILAVMIGLVLTLIFQYSKSLIPCVIFHSINNILSVFAINQPSAIMVQTILIIVIMSVYIIYIQKTFKLKK